MLQEKTLVLIRHAHRDTSQRSLDNGLSAKGFRQSQELLQFFEKRWHGTESDWKFLSSPKRRCIETIEPLAGYCEQPLSIHQGLDEEHAGEGGRAFSERIATFLQEWQKSDWNHLVICSHGDWLPVAAEQLLGTRVNFKKGSWLELTAYGTAVELQWLIQDFKSF